MATEPKVTSETKTHSGSTPAPKANKPLAYSPGSSGGVVTIGVQDVNFSRDEIKNLAGDLAPGEIGWVKLDEEGEPTGPATRGMPDISEGPVAKVVGSPKVAYDEIVTPSGAPVTKQMNPDTQLWDSGMLARNPTPPRPDYDNLDVGEVKVRPPTGGQVVINQPVIT